MDINALSRRILVVDDDDINLSVVKRLLKAADIIADDAKNGLEAFNKIVTTVYAAVLIDIEMPLLTGLETTKLIRTLGRYRQVSHLTSLPIIALTASQDQTVLQECYRVGVNEVIHKPIHPSLLLTILSRYVKHDVHPPSVDVNPQHVEPDISAELLQLTDLNLREAITRIGGSEMAYRRQLIRFENNHRHAVQTLTHALSSGKTRAAAQYCHALRGVLSNLGDTNITALLKDIEHDIKIHHPIDASKINRVSLQLSLLFKQIARLTPLGALASIEVSVSDVIALKNKLIYTLKYDIAHVTPLVEQLMSALKDTVLYSQIQRIASDIDLFKIDEAVHALDVLDVMQLDKSYAV